MTYRVELHIAYGPIHVQPDSQQSILQGLLNSQPDLRDQVWFLDKLSNVKRLRFLHLIVPGEAAGGDGLLAGMYPGDRFVGPLPVHAEKNKKAPTDKPSGQQGQTSQPLRRLSDPEFFLQFFFFRVYSPKVYKRIVSWPCS
ncbi:MAG: hypothetical protein GXP58_05320 [Deltaproteobacteria bacterium]|nr:hypothetical protein [Deltaproteobacteria bacterium]